jgi:hypothetical protein
MIMPNRLLLIGALVGCQIATAWAKQPAPDKPVWNSTVQGNEASLVFMTPGSDETELTFSCRTKSGRIDFFVGDASPLKPNVPQTGSFIVGRISFNFAGRTIPNELSGTSSFKGSMPGDAPIFTALTGDGNLEIRIGKSSQKLPLKTIRDHAPRFAASCRK